MKKYFLLPVICFLPWVLWAQKEQYTVNFSLWHPVATATDHPGNRVVANLGLYSRNYQLEGIGINAVATTVNHSVSGMLLSGVMTTVLGDMVGFQLSAVQNTNIGNTRGVMVAAMTNFGIGDTRGMQLAGVVNMAGSAFRGVQVAAGINIASASSHTVQLAGIANISAESLNGVQIGLGNYAGAVKGVQLGILNVCGGEVKGVQIGLINHSTDTSTVKIGLVNINPKTNIQMLVYGENTNKTNVAVRFTNRHIYTILGFGTHYLGTDGECSGSFFYRAGLTFSVARRWALSGDLGYSHIENFESANSRRPERLYSLQGRVNLEYKIVDHLAAMVSGGFAHTRYYSHNRIFENKPVVGIGLVFF